MVVALQGVGGQALRLIMEQGWYLQRVVGTPPLMTTERPPLFGRASTQIPCSGGLFLTHEMAIPVTASVA